MLSNTDRKQPFGATRILENKDVGSRKAKVCKSGRANMNYLSLTNAVQRRTRLVTDVNAALLDDKDLSCR